MQKSLIRRALGCPLFATATRGDLLTSYNGTAITYDEISSNC